MELLYSNILPLPSKPEQTTVSKCFYQEVSGSDRIAIASGYASKASLIALDEIVRENKIRHILVILGMYFIEGIPESLYNTAIEINKRWCSTGIGEIRLVTPFKYHGKLYTFYRYGTVKSAIIGSANLGVIKQDANNLRQYEISALVTESKECNSIASFISDLASPKCSINIGNVNHMHIIREVNTSLIGVDTVEHIPCSEVRLYKNYMTATKFILPIKVPAFEERFMDDGRHFTKSNLNVSYAAPRSRRKSRDWYETQLTVSKSITLQPGYPEKNVPFFVVTDDGYTFKVHTTSDGNKQFSAVGDELILGRWIKGRLAAAGLVNPVNDTQADTDRRGMITKEMLSAYGCDTLILTKTSKQMLDEDGTLLDIWILSFESGTYADGGD